MESSVQLGLPVGELLAFSDAELAEYMAARRRPGGGFELDDLDGWDTLPNTDRQRLAARLRTGATAASNAARSRPVDLDEVTARLLGDSANDDASLPRPARQAGSPPTFGGPLHAPEERRETMQEVTSRFDREAREQETVRHQWLLAEGGRPLYPIGLLNEVSANVDLYRDLLRPWLEAPHAAERDDWTYIFGTQLESWRSFHTWQKEQRGIYDYDAEYRLFMARLKLDSVLTGATELWARIENDAARNKMHFDLAEDRRRREQYRLVEPDDGNGFPAYAEAMYELLARHGFVRPFQLSRDPAQQDTLTTWIEYLGFGYCCLDGRSEDVRKLQASYDAAWTQLVNSGVLRPGETTREALSSIPFLMRLEADKDAAANEVQVAKSAAMEVLASRERDVKQPGFDEAACLRAIQGAQARLDKAKAALKQAKRRIKLIGEFLRGTSGHELAKREVERHVHRVQWMLEQIPLIEAESKEPPATGGCSQPAGGGTKRRRGPDHDNPATEQQAVADVPDLKRQRPTKRARTQGEGQPVPATAAPLRRSARIAALQPSKTVTALPDTVKKPGRPRKAKLTPPPPPRPRATQPTPRSTTVLKRKTKESGDLNEGPKPNRAAKTRRKPGR